MAADEAGAAGDEYAHCDASLDHDVTPEFGGLHARSPEGPASTPLSWRWQAGRLGVCYHSPSTPTSMDKHTSRQSPVVVRDGIPWARPDFWGNEFEYVHQAMQSTWISGGEFVDRLEREIAEWSGVRHALAVNNGTSAIQLAYLAVGLRPGDEVVVPGFGFLAAANVALNMGAVPVFADVAPDTWCVTAAAVAACLTARTRAVVPVHTYGNACAMDPIMELCRAKDIPVIEDAAEAFGTRYRGRYLGSIGDLGTLSFQATKTITTGEGGMVLTSRDELVEPMTLYRSHGMLRRRYLHEVAGYNFRLTNLQAALGCAQFERIEDIIAARRRMQAAYEERLSPVDGVTLQVFESDVEPVLWAVSARLDQAFFPQGRDAVIAHLQADGIETRNGFCSPVEMPHLYGSVNDIPVARALSDWVISLPSYPTLSVSDIDRVCASLLSVRRVA